jgi:two-component system, cell cycle sensor histidine kinase PleC
MSAESYRILVADDEPTLLDAYRTVLSDITPTVDADSAISRLEAKLFGAKRQTGLLPTYSPVLCRSGERAVETLREMLREGQACPLAFLDVRMPPGIDGIETAVRIRALDPDINIVIVTAYADSHPREIAERVPPVDKLFYVSKPFQKMELQQFALALTAKWNAERASARLNGELTARCRELETAHSEIVRARVQAETANHAKSEFLANMSHELRTPLNAVIGFTDMMRHEAFGPVGHDRYRQYLEDIANSGKHLMQMINDLLDLSTIEIGKIRLSIGSLDLGGIIADVVSLMRLQAEQAGIELREEHQIRNVVLQADENRLRQVLLNLLSNATKFTPRSGSVTIGTRIDDSGALCISVADTGIGIAAEDQAIALEPFGQIEHGLARNYQGAGLGLTIAKKLTELQGGALTLQSELGQGTTITVRFLPTNYSVKTELHLVASR